MNTVTFRYGATRELVRDVGTGTTLGEALRDPTLGLRSGLGLPENVSAVVDGRTLSQNDRFNDGDVVTFEKQAATKAA